MLSYDNEVLLSITTSVMSLLLVPLSFDSRGADELLSGFHLIRLDFGLRPGNGT
jgi:hypothetical protein